MSSIAMIGDCTTTTALAIAARWPASSGARAPSASGNVCVVECDPRGGSLAGWLDMPTTPSISTAVTTLHQIGGIDATRAAWAALDPLIRTSRAGPRVLPAPFRAREARSAVNEAMRGLIPLLATVPDTVALLDLGRFGAHDGPALLAGAAPVVVVHRQDTSSAAAAAVRLERLGETFEVLRASGHEPELALIGADPFPAREIGTFVELRSEPHLLPIDPLAAAVLAGRTGVSARRLARLPLMRGAISMARRLHDATATSVRRRASTTGAAPAPDTRAGHPTPTEMPA